MVFKDAMYKGTLAVLTQSELLEFERMLASAPEVYDYCAHMTDQQLNYLIAFLSRSRENTMIESRQVKEALDEALRASASKDETLKARDAELEELKAALKEKDAALAKKDRVIRDKNKTLAKKDNALAEKDKHISDLEEQLEESKVNRYGRRRMKSKDEKASGKSGDVKDDKNKDDDGGNNGSNANPGGADRQQCEEEYDGVTPQEPVTEDRSGEGKNSSSTDCTFNPKNRPECYKTMGLREVSGVKGLKELLKNTEHKFDLSRLPAGAIVKARRYRTFYTMRTILLKETIEQLRVKLPGEKHARWMYIPMRGEEGRRPVDGTKASPELLQALAYETYVKRVTGGVLHGQLKDLGMQISKGTLKNWLEKGKGYMDSLVKELKERALERDSILNCDETWCRVRRYNRYLKKYMWVLVNKAEKIVIFFYDEGSRGRHVLTDFLGDAEVKAIMTDGYNAYNFIGGELEADHLICMAHVLVKFGKAYEMGGDAIAEEFIRLIRRLYALERSYKEKGYTAEQIYAARQSEETGEIERQLRELLSKELSRENPNRSYYMKQALNYFDHFKDDLFRYRKDGNYPIDNNLAERQVRPFTAMRKGIQHYGSDGGAERAAVYLSVVSTVKLAGVSVWKFLGYFFEDMVTGGSKHRALLKLSAA